MDGVDAEEDDEPSPPGAVLNFSLAKIMEIEKNHSFILFVYLDFVVM